MYERFAQLLQENGVTPYRIAKDTGITQATLSDWKKGRSTPKQDKMQKIADYFNVSIEWLTGSSPYRTMLEKLDAEMDIEKMQREVIEAERNSFIPDPEDVAVEKEETQRDIDRYALTEKDEKDIAKELNNIMGKMRSGDDGPLRYEGAEIDDESMNLLEAAINMTLKQLKRENKEKYDPYKNKR